MTARSLAGPGYAAGGPLSAKQVPSSLGLKGEQPILETTMTDIINLDALPPKLLDELRRDTEKVSYLLAAPASENATSRLLATPTIEPASRPQRTAGSACRTQLPARAHFVPRELAARWGVSIDKVLAFIRTGELRAFNVASQSSKRPRYRIPVDEVRRFEEQTRAAAPQLNSEPKPKRQKKRAANATARRTYF